MNKKSIFILIGAVIIAGIIWYWSKASQKDENITEINREAQLILFYGRECPHCQELEKFIADNGIRDKVSFENLEVYHNKNNSQFLLEKAKGCGISENEIGVPFFYTRGKCLVGAPDIEDFLKKEAGM
jgi:hypothetical protein